MKPKSNAKLAGLFDSGTRLKYLLEECEFGTGFKHLTNEQWGEMWDLFYTWLKQNQSNEEDVLDFVSLVLDSDKDTGNVVKTMKLLLSKTEKTTEIQFRNAFCKLCEKWLSVEAAPAVPGMDCFVFRHLLTLSSDELTTANVNRLCRFRKNLNSELVFAHVGIVNKLIQNPKFIDIKAGQKFFVVAASQSTPIFNKCFSTITLELKECSKKTAENYGKALMLTWKEANDEMKIGIASKFQELMVVFLTLKRLTLALPKHSANILSLIDVWNKEVRQKADPAFSTMITGCYQPILWKYYATGPSFQRCNAADLFYKAFPLSVIDDPDADAALFMDQVDHMERTLMDDWHVTRIVAIREICNILAVHWSIFSTVQINRLMKIIAKKEVCDTSSAEVRRMVWRGFESLLTTDLACSYLQQFLPNLNTYLHDVSAIVRIAFVKLLIAIRDLKKPDFKVSSIVSTSELMKCLQYEDSTVGPWLVKLLMPSFYNPKHTETEWIRKFSIMIKKYPYCYRHFFFFSKKYLKFENALDIMCKLIENLGAFVMTKLRAANEENDPLTANLSSRRSSEASKFEESAEGNTCAYDDPKIAVGLLEILAILWVLHGETLTKKPSDSAKLINTYLGHAQHFIMYYKNTPVFQTVIHLTGNVPMNVLTKNSITLNGYCMKVLKSHQAGELDEDSTLTMISALVKWGRCGELLEMITLWLEAALKPNDSDELESQVKRVKISDAVNPDSLLAVSFLNKILERSVTRLPTLKKNYANLVEIFNLMDNNIKSLINLRLLRGTPYTEELLSDEFLMACYRRYVKLIPLLHREDDLLSEEEREYLVDAPLKFKDLIAWIQDDLIPLLHSEQPADFPFIAMCINGALETAENMLKVNYVDHEEFPKFEQVITSLLILESNLHFVKASTSLTAAMTAYSMVYLLDKNPRVWFVIIPNLFTNIMNALVLRTHSQEEIHSFKQDLHVVATSINKIIDCYGYCLKHQITVAEMLSCVPVMIQSTLNCARLALNRIIIQENNTIPSYPTVASLPPIPATLLGSLNNHHQSFWLSSLLQHTQEHISTTASLKSLLIDVLILHLVKKIDNDAVKVCAKRAVKAARNRLEHLKNHQRTDIRPSVSLLARESVNNTEELGTQPTSAAALSRDSEPCSNVVTVGTEPRESETGCVMMECEQSSASQPTEVPLSQTAVSGSQPNEPRTLPSTECRASTMSHLQEEELLADGCIQCVEELLKLTTESIEKPAKNAKPPENEQAATSTPAST